MQTIDLFFFEGIKRKLLIEGVQQPAFQIRQLRGQVAEISVAIASLPSSRCL